jgi:hypothetical protein
VSKQSLFVLTARAHRFGKLSLIRTNGNSLGSPKHSLGANDKSAHFNYWLKLNGHACPEEVYAKVIERPSLPS